MALRLFASVLFLALTASLANAYTIVMRDGRRVEIPNEYTVTNSTLTYEIGNGIQVTIQLSGVDVAATERANGQSSGSFYVKREVPRTVPAAPQTRGPAQRSVTNKDLEVYRRARVESEQEYEKNRRELGLPSLEERRKETAEIEERTLQQLLSMRAQQQQEEESQRNRAEILTLQTQIEYLRRRLEETPNPYAFDPFLAGFPFGTVVGPFGNIPFQAGISSNLFSPFHSGFNGRFGGHFGFGHRRRVFVAPRQFGNRFNSPGRVHNPGGGFNRGRR